MLTNDGQSWNNGVVTVMVMNEHLCTLPLLLELVIAPGEVGYSEAEVPDDRPL